MTSLRAHETGPVMYSFQVGKSKIKIDSKCTTRKAAQPQSASGREGKPGSALAALGWTRGAHVSHTEVRRCHRKYETG